MHAHTRWIFSSQDMLKISLFTMVISKIVLQWGFTFFLSNLRLFIKVWRLIASTTTMRVCVPFMSIIIASLLLCVYFLPMLHSILAQSYRFNTCCLLLFLSCFCPLTSFFSISVYLPVSFHYLLLEVLEDLPSACWRQQFEFAWIRFDLSFV